MIAEGERRYLGPLDALQLSPVDILLIGAFARPARCPGAGPGAGRDRTGCAAQAATVLIVSHELDLLQSLCDEIWWLDAGRWLSVAIRARCLDAYRESIAEKVRAWGATLKSRCCLSMRRGDGRAEILSLETLDSAGKPTAVWHERRGRDRARRSALPRSVEEPVIGILIRTRIGLEVYGTNTELEKVSTGTCAAGQRMRIEFTFRCDLCPGEYTITAASHDADGTAHDWLDDAVAFNVADSRYTAGVANLRAKVTLDTNLRAGWCYFCSSMKVGAMPDSVENPDGPTAVSQLEQPCTLPR